MSKMNFYSALMGVVQFYLERPVSPDGKIASSSLVVPATILKACHSSKAAWQAFFIL